MIKIKITDLNTKVSQEGFLSSDKEPNLRADIEDIWTRHFIAHFHNASTIEHHFYYVHICTRGSKNSIIKSFLISDKNEHYLKKRVYYTMLQLEAKKGGVK